MSSKAGSVIRFFLLDLLGSVLHFPFWWYTDGFQIVLQWIKRSLIFRWKSFSLTIWIKNLFVPMYGQYDLVGRLVSIFMRIVVLIGRLIFLFVEALLYTVLALLWLLALPLLIALLAIGISRGVVLPHPALFSYGF
ncbi:MAG TPA: hypothetical protein VFQ60_02785 [Patescibacteria group bacterium]|nr:hypothetical protein [Patescibacteria group bacterium]